MKYLKLYCDQPGFKTLSFNREGLTLIIGAGSNDKNKEGSSNGVGKTLALGLIHHCLGANADKKLIAAVPDWFFFLDFEINGKEYRVARSGDGKQLFFNEEKVSLKEYREWLDHSGVFFLDGLPYLSFRSLFKRFARYSREDCLLPIKTAREPDFDARLRTLYLLGIDCNLVVSKQQLKKELDTINHTIKNWQHDQVLKDVFRAGTQPKVRTEFLEKEIPLIKRDLDNFQIAEDYREIELEAAKITMELRAIEKQASIIEFQLAGIEKTLKHHPDISKDELLELYEGLQAIFKPKALEHFDAVEKFHLSLSANRKTRLESDRLGLLSNLSNCQQSIKTLIIERDEKMQLLKGKRALDEYVSLANKLADMQEEHTRLKEFLNLSSTLQEKTQQMRERRVEEDRLAVEYANLNPIHNANQYFSEIVEKMYPRSPAGIVVEANTGDNQVRYDLTVQIEGDDSDGINAACIVAFDWVVFMKGHNHSIGALWHDNRFFAHMDPPPRAAWFSYVLSVLQGTGKQYMGDRKDSFVNE
jgi:uncharacterized protein YydD (DUF2326 family)